VTYGKNSLVSNCVLAVVAINREWKWRGNDAREIERKREKKRKKESATKKQIVHAVESETIAFTGVIPR